jgi:hypothetical protein
MSTTDAHPPVTPPVDKLNLKDIKWVAMFTGTLPNTELYGADDGSPSDSKDGWRSRFNQLTAPEPGEPFPDIDSNGNPCRVLTIDPATQQSVKSSWNTHVFVAYPDGVVRRIPTKESYNTHGEAKLSHFAMAALAAWPAGESRHSPSSYNGQNSAASTMTPGMWDRATVQGYLKSPESKTGTYSPRVRTSKPINANIKRSRKLKSSAWPFSEKEHWFRIMSGALQITHTNLSNTLNSRRGGMSSREMSSIRKSFPVFSTCASFKRSRKFFEQLSEKKNTNALRPESQRTNDKGMRWDPLKNDGFQVLRGYRYDTRQTSDTLFSTPYALVATSMMLGCVPSVDEEGVINDYREITKEHIQHLKDITPIAKSVVGAWEGRESGYSHSDRPTPRYSPYILDAANIDNLTHMYLVLLNETHLLSNEDLVRWCTHQGITLTKTDFTVNHSPRYEHSICGYQLTDTLHYTCITQGKPL